MSTKVEQKKSLHLDEEEKTLTENLEYPNSIIAQLNKMFKCEVKIVKLKGYSYSNKSGNYQEAKAPVGKWKDNAGLTDQEIQSWIKDKGWIGMVVPDGYDIVDIDDKETSEIIFNALQAKGVKFHACKTPNGYHFYFKSNGSIKKQDSKLLSAVGALIDHKPGGKGYVVIPSPNTDNRKWVLIENNEIDEVPVYFDILPKNLNKEEKALSLPITDGNRNNKLAAWLGFLHEAGKWDKGDLKKITFFLADQLCEPSYIATDGEEALSSTIESVLSNKPSGNDYEDKDYGRKSAIEVISEAINKMQKDPGAVLESDVIERLLYLEQKYAAEYVRLEQEISKNGVGKRRLQTELKKLKDKRAQNFKKEQEEENPLDKWSIIDGQLKKGRWTPDGISYEVITRTPPVIRNVLTHSETNEEYWKLSFKTVRGQPVEEVVPRADMANPHILSNTLSRFGFDVNQSNARDVSDYLRDYDAAHAEKIPLQRYADRFGWTKDFKSFLIGNDIIGRKDIVYQAPGAGEQQIADALTIKGDLDNWKKVIKLLEGRKWALFKVFQSFLPPLLPFLGLNGHVFSNHGESSLGKTLSDSIAGSVWGNINYKAGQDSIIQQGVGITLDKAEKIIATMTHIPVFLQDTHEANQGVIPRIVHAVEIGQGKGRGHNSDGSQAFRKVNTVLSITSEAPLESQSKNGGIYARAIEFNGSVFGTHDLMFKENVMDIIFEHYGIPGRSFIEYLLKNFDDRDSWKKQFRDYKKEMLSELAERNVKLDDKVERKIDYFLAVLVAGQLARHALDLPICKQEIKSIVNICFHEQATMTDSSPYYEKGMNALRDFITGNRPQFFTVGNRKTEADGLYKEVPGLWNENSNYIAMTNSTVRNVLDDRGYDLNRCMSDWIKNGYVNTNKKGETSMVTYVPYSDSRMRMLRFPIDVIQSDEEED